MCVAAMRFHACDLTDVRFVNGQNYRIVRPPPMYLYERGSRAGMA